MSAVARLGLQVEQTNPGMSWVKELQPTGVLSVGGLVAEKLHMATTQYGLGTDHVTLVIPRSLDQAEQDVHFRPRTRDCLSSLLVVSHGSHSLLHSNPDRSPGSQPLAGDLP